jgi:hypothetical protein
LIKFLPIIFCFFLLTACSGGGGGGSDAAPSPSVASSTASATGTASSVPSTKTGTTSGSATASTTGSTTASTKAATKGTTTATAASTTLETTPAPATSDASSPLPTSTESSKPEQTAAFVLPAGARRLVQPASTDTSSDLSTESQLLIDCVVLLKEEAGCSADTLPLIGMVTDNPSIEQIMQRVLVSHAWMGPRFREILERMPPEMLLLMRGVTAIVISFDIRPSHFQPYSGAIYLDPNVMWLSQDERDAIEDTPDFRTDFNAQLQFSFLRRYVDGNTDIKSFPRGISSISIKTASVLYHELAHANDFFSPANLQQVNRSVPIHLSLSQVSPSSRLSSTYPLQSFTLNALAAVSFLGESASLEQETLSAADAAAQFSADYSSDYYNYTNRIEDLAMVFEEAMMFHSFGLQKDVAFTQTGNTSCSGYIVEWGQRNRLADPAVQTRANFAVAELLPEYAAAVENSLASMPAVRMMSNGVDWCENIRFDVG